MDKLEALVALNMINGIGSVRLTKLLEFFSRPEDIFKASDEKLAAVFGIGSDLSRRIHCFDKKALDKELALAKKFGLNIFSLDDSEYPANLKYISGPPLVLYVKGSLLAQDRLSIAIVGSRRASFYGLSCAEKFAGELAGYGFTVVSGMARGIDTAGHKGALKNNGRTIAVIGSGFGRIYPPENMELAEKISCHGAVISEFPVNTEPLRQNFPRRNRVISGLSAGVLVVEAAINSGALITVDFALEQGREVFALPGKIDFPNASGTNALIKQGAKLVSCIDDIIEEFGLGEGAPVSNSKQHKQADSLLSNEESVLSALMDRQEPVSFDEMAQQTQMTIPLLSQVVFGLEVRHLIKQLPGKRFLKN